MPQRANFWETILATQAPKPRRNRLLIYLWKLIPATTDSMHFPATYIKNSLYNRFLADCRSLNNTDIVVSFEAACKKYNYPWSPGNTLAEASGCVWVKVFAQAAIKVGLKVRNAKTKSLEEIGKEVAGVVEKKVYAEWCPVLDRIFEEAWKLEKAEKEDGEVGMPVRFGK
jgi:hypothetical protein